MTKEQIEARLAELRLRLISLNNQAEVHASDINRSQELLNETTDLIEDYEYELGLLESALAKVIDAQLDVGYSLPQLKVSP